MHRNRFFIALVICIALVVFYASGLNAAITKVQGAFCITETDASVTKSFTNTPTEGNLLIALGRGTTAYTNASISGWTRATWTLVGSAACIDLFYKVAGAAESKDVQLDWTSSTLTNLAIEEWGGFTGTPTLDQIADVDNTGSTVTSRSSGTTATTTAAAELCIAGFATAGSAVTNESWSNSFTEEAAQQVGTLYFFLGSLIVSSTGTYETTLSWTTARLAGGLIATFMGVSGDTVPAVTTISISNITNTTASGGGNVTDDGGDAVTDRGVCWDTSTTPTTADSHTHDGNGKGSFASSLSGLTARLKYYVRAWATNGVGTAYGEEVTFTTTGDGLAFYVNTAADAGGDGTTDALTGAHCAWDTIADVNAHSFAGDDFVYLRAGCTWNEELHIPSAGTLGHPITFTSYGSGVKPILDGTGLDYCVHESVGKGYITLDGLEFADPTLLGVFHAYCPAGVFGATPNWIIQNCTFTHCSCAVNGPNIIVQDCIFHGPQPGGSLGAALAFRGAVSSNCSALRNTIEGFTDRGIWFMQTCDTPTANYNIIHDVPSGEGYGIDFDGYGYIITGIVTAIGNTIYNIAPLWGIFMENCSEGSIIKNNLIYNCTDAGIAYLNYAAWSGHYTEQRGNNVGGQVSYNVIYGCNKGLFCQDMGGIDFWNNVVDDGSGTAKGVGMSASSAAYATDYDIRNNIFGSGLTYVVSVPGTDWTTVVLDFDYNCVENITIMHEKGNSHTHNLATLQGLGRALNCFTTAPGFVDDAGHDYHLLSSSPCINTGVNVGLTEDYAGNSVPIGGMVDIGAYEYQGTGGYPEINITDGANNIADGGTFAFGTKGDGSNTDQIFTLENKGDANLTLGGSPIITITGTYADQFSVQVQPTSPIAGATHVHFTLRFTPTSAGAKIAAISIVNDDVDENPYDITLTGTGVVEGEDTLILLAIKKAIKNIIKSVIKR